MLKLQYSTKVPWTERERNTKKNNIMKKTIISMYLLALIAVLIVILTSCNVTRTVATASQYYQKGDTSVVITTKTIETYDASKK